MNSVFFSGSISIRSLPDRIKDSLDKIKKDNDFKILVGDAPGFDSLLQRYCADIGFTNVSVYSITEKPRNLFGDFNTIYIKVPDDVKSTRSRQTFKDVRMTLDSDISFVVWDQKSTGSYNNIIRAIKENKVIRVYSTLENKPILDISESNITKIYKNTNGLTSDELLGELYKNGIKKFDNTKQLKSYLIENRYLLKEENKNKVVYKTINENYSFDEFYRGKLSRVKFKIELLLLLVDKLKSKNSSSGYGSIRG